MKCRVLVSKTSSRGIVIEVDADTISQAEKIAREKVNDIDFDKCQESEPEYFVKYCG